jgi:hypothetical protein
VRHLDAALRYAQEFSLAVFPVWHLDRWADGRITCGCRAGADCRDAGKHPKGVLARHGYKDATTNTARITSWWGGRPVPNIACAAGASGLVVVDIDVRNGGDNSLSELEARHGGLSPSWMAISGSGGSHCYFRAPAVELRCRDGALGRGIDIKAAGGAVVMPPSAHVSGRRYSWCEGHAPWEIPLAPLPDWIIRALAQPSHGRATPPYRWRDLVRNGAVEGERNSSLYRLACHLFHPPFRGIDFDVALELLSSWNETRNLEPLDDAEVERAVQSAFDHAQSQRRLRNIRR